MPKLKVLTIGNSYADSVFLFLPKIAAAAGCDLLLERANIGGCSLKRHWEEHLKSCGDSTYKPYYGKFSLKDKLSSCDWDIVTIQQASYESWKIDSYEPYAGNIIKTIKRYAPKSEIIIQQTWSYNANDPRLIKKSKESWGFDQKGMFEKLDCAYRTLAEKYQFRVIPTGLALQYSRNIPGNGDLAGFTISKENGEKVTDFIHLNNRGEYMQSCLWFAFLFNRKVADIKFIPDEISESDALILQQCAQSALDNYIQVSPGGRQK